MDRLSNSDNDLAIESILAAFDSNGKVPLAALRKSGLHRIVVKNCYDMFTPEIKNLVGWKRLKEFEYTPFWRYVDHLDVKNSKALTSQWLAKLEMQHLSDEYAVLLYDGELELAPAHYYRLFVLQDGRLLWYEGGFYARSIDNREYELVCGDVITVLSALDERYPNRGYYASISAYREPFVNLLRSFIRALEGAIAYRKSEIAKQEALNERIVSMLDRLDVK